MTTGIRRQSPWISKSPLLIAVVLIVALFCVPLANSGVSTSTPTLRFGFWLQDSTPLPAAQTFFNAMFLTPPYPSSMEVMIFAILQDQIANDNPSASNSYTTASINYWSQIAQLADSYPNIRLVFDIAFNPASSTYGMSAYEMIVSALSKYPSVYGLGVEGEYTSETLSLMTTAMSYVTSVGKLFISYYTTNGDLPSGGYEIYETGFPGGSAAESDQVSALGAGTNSYDVGISSGYFASFQFPGTVTCPIGANAMGPSTWGWNQCVVSTEFSTAVSISPASTRQFVEFVAGLSSSGSFTGVSGLTTNQLWDNPTLRNWIWTDPNYQSHFILSTSSGTTTTSTTTSSTSSTTSTSQSTTSATSTSSSTTTSSTSAGSLEVDGTASGTSSPITITTTHSNDVIILEAACQSGVTVTVSGGGLTWAQRFESDYPNGGYVYWAAAPNALSSASISIKASGGSCSGFIIFGVSGANTANPFDTHSGLPVSTVSGSASPSTTVATTNANDLIFGATWMNTSPTYTAGSGFTLLAGDVGSGAPGSIASEYRIVSVAQSGLTVGATLSASDDNEMMADAIVAAG